MAYPEVVRALRYRILIVNIYLIHTTIYLTHIVIQVLLVTLLKAEWENIKKLDNDILN